MIRLRAAILTTLLILGATALRPEGAARIAFGALKTDPTLPVEITSQQLEVNQADGTALFSGEVVVGQGEMRLSADKVLVIYAEGGNGVERLVATGDVVLVNGPDAARSDRAEYTIASGVIVMTGNVLLTQGPNALTSDRMTVNLTDGTANMTGGVKTIIRPEGD